jgi:hypothetical protein
MLEAIAEPLEAGDAGEEIGLCRSGQGREKFED